MTMFLLVPLRGLAAILLLALASCDPAAEEAAPSSPASSLSPSAAGNACLAGSSDTRSCFEIITSRRSTSKDLAYAFNARGAAYGNAGDNDRALGNVEQAIRYYGKEGMFFYNRGKALASQKRFGDAITDYNKAEARGYQLPRLYYARAVAYNAINDRQHAYSDLLEFSRLTEPAQRDASISALLSEYGVD
jgi:tetratricopeptide (TPR) repeat protein